MSLRSAPVFGPTLPGQAQTCAAHQVPHIELDEDSSRADYWCWADPLRTNCLHEAGLALSHSCIVPQRDLLQLIWRTMLNSGLRKVTSIGSGQALLEWLLSEHCLCMCVDVFHDDDGEWLIPPARLLQRQPSTGEYGMQFIQLLPEHPIAPVDPESVLLFCWGLCLPEVAREYTRRHSRDGKAIMVIADDTCCPTAQQVQTWLQEGRLAQPREWIYAVEDVAATLGAPCTISVFVCAS